MTRTPRRLGLGLALAAALATLSSSAGPVYAAVQKTGMICTNGSLSGTTRTFHLVAKSGHVQTPDGNSLLMWSYANGDVNGSPFQEPGPVLCANQGETVNVILTDNLTIKNGSGGTDPVNTSIVFPGQESVTASGGSAGLLTTEAGNGGGAVTYSFTAGQPGTYLYESGTDVTMQVEMGLYGALIIRPTGAGFGPSYAYDNASTKFSSSREYLLLLSDIDPDLHHAVETGHTYDFTTKHDRYYMINGRDFPDTVQDNGTPLLPDQPYGALVRIEPNSATTNPDPALIRMINVGTDPPPVPPARQPYAADLAGRPAAAVPGRVSRHHRALRRDDRLGRDAGLPAALGRRRPVEPQHQSAAGRAAQLPQPHVQGFDHLVRRQPVPGLQGHVAGRHQRPQHLRRVVLPAAQPRPERVLELQRGLRRHGHPASSRSARRLLHIPLRHDAGRRQAQERIGERTAALRRQLLPGQPGDHDQDRWQHPLGRRHQPHRGLEHRVPGASVLRPGRQRGAAGDGTLGHGQPDLDGVAGQLGSLAASHAANVTLTALATDWYASFSGVVTGASNLSVTYAGKNCANTTGTACTALTTNLPQQTVKICDWTVGGAAGCSTATSAGWVTLPAPQNIGVGSAGASNAWSAVAPFNHYVGTGSNRGQVRVLVHTQRWTPTSPTPFSTWGDLMKLVYTAP